VSRILSRFVPGLAPFLILLASVGGEAAYAATAPPHSAGTELTLPPVWRFEEPLIATASTTPKEDQALLVAIKAYRSQSDPGKFQAFKAYLADYPQSGWRLALLTDMGLSCYRAGYFGEALQDWEDAWQAGKPVTERRGKILADRAVGELIQMHARLGHTDQVAGLLREIEHRPLVGPAVSEVEAAKQALWLMRHEPGTSFRCGPMALKSLLLLQHTPANKLQVVETYPSSSHGLTLDEVSHLADKAGLPHQVVFRTAGQPVPVPSLVHWKVDHFAAIVGESNGRFHVKDPTFGTDLWITQAAIDAEASGYFMVPAEPKLVAGTMRCVDSIEASGIRGMGQTAGNVPTATKTTDPSACQCSPTAGGVEHSLPSSAEQSLPPNPSNNQSLTGMADYNIKEMLVDLNISDTPVGYAPPKGPSVFVTLTYNQLEANQPSNFTFFNLSSQWTMNWLGYVQDDPTQIGASVLRYELGGGSVNYGNYNSGTGAFDPEPDDASTLVVTSWNPVRYENRLIDGSVQVYTHSDGSTSSPRRVFLTEIIDPAGNTVTLHYDAELRLTSITDAIGRSTTFSYGLSGTMGQRLLITKITDPFGRSALLNYDSSYRLIQITDTLGLKSKFTYNGAQMTDITAMTTPYGTTQFSYGSTDGNERFLNATDPLGHTERVEYIQGVSTIPFSDPGNTIPNGIVAPFNEYLNYRDSYYWDKNAYQLAAGDYTKARIRHWTHLASNTSLTSNPVESIKYPLENRVWMNYPGQPNCCLGTAQSGSFNEPSLIGRVLDDGTTKLTQFTYNALGHVTDMIDPVGRETQYTYASNQIDLLQVQQRTSASAFSTIATFAYNAQHLPLTYTDAAGQTISYSYNSAGQRTQTTNSLNQTTTYQYDSSGNLTHIVNANNQTAASFTYDAVDRVATSTDSEGYVVQYAYDTFNRVTTETYADGTTRQFTWTNLDLTNVKDRQNRVTVYSYDAMRRLAQIKDPLGRITKFGYFTNGKLQSLTDPNGNTTAWSIDIQNRVAGKQYADGSQVANTYENTTSRLKEVTDALTQVKQYSYNLDDSLAGITYANAAHATPTVTFAYDPYFQRLASMTDGSGTTNYTYQPIGILGALQPLKETGPYTNGTIAYQYDALGRVKTRTVDTTLESFTYDSLGRPKSHGTPLGNFALGYLGQTNQLASQLLNTGLGTKWTYHTNTNDRRLKDITNSGATRSYQFTTTSENDIAQIAETAPLGSAWAPQTWNYSYDESDRLLTGQSSSGLRYAYTNDPADNITAFSNPSGNEGAIYNDLNQVKSFGVSTYIYDANGNVLDDGARTYQWDAENRLIEVGHKTGLPGTTTFRYDGLSRRIAIAYNGVETRYLWCGNSMCQARSSGDAITRHFYPEGESILSSGQLLYYAPDQLGSVRDVLAVQNGSRVASFDYDPYGNSIQSNGRVETDFKYAGMFYDQQDALYLTQYRAYDPQIGRWLSRDPMAEAQGSNLYDYVRNLPIQLT
jgi:RHS repeat-associated protein